MGHFTYIKEKTREISFPLGGIGTGCIGLAGNGQLVDMEIFNRPNKGSHSGMSHFAIKAERENEVLDARVLNGDSFAPYTGKFNRPHFYSYGFGSDRASLAGLPHFRDCEFTGEFPMASLRFVDQKFPGQIVMTAFNPFIPTNEDDSSIPGAFFEFAVTNTADCELEYTIGFTMNNLYAKSGGIHTDYDYDDFRFIHMTNEDYEPDDVQYGDLCMAVIGHDLALQQYWYRGKMFDNLATYWKEFSAPGKLKNRVYETKKSATDSNYAADDLAVLTSSQKIGAEETKIFRFLLTWNCPNYYNYWNPEKDEEAEKKRAWKNYYAVLFENSMASALYGCKNWERLYSQTKLFKDTLFDSSMPMEALDAVSANLSIIKSPTCIRLEDGSLYGFEGNHIDSGCCEGSCTHVWNYTYAIPFLFPRLERSMRTLEYTYSMKEDGSMGFRLMLPLGRKPWDFHACVDGQYGTVMRVLREYKVSGDKAWLEKIWPNVKKTIEFAWSPENMDQWDSDRNGVMEGRQHHTLDMELFGENAWLTGMYLGGLKAGAELAKIMGEEDTAADYLKLFESGKKVLNSELYNGEYYYQKIDLKDRSVLQPYVQGIQTIQKQDIYDAYWNTEREELMYQIGEGCGVDQVLAQWHGNLIGLGEIFEKEQVKSALQSIYRYNFICARDHFNPCRLYCVDDEKGLLICNWPKGKIKPFITAPYSEETMHGFEYQAAIHMIQEGFEECGMECIRAIRERYDGEKRNPWNEYECGSNYARSMASYGLLLTFSGFKYNMGEKMMGFEPIHPENFRSFWSLDSGWGKVVYEERQVDIQVLYGEISLSYLELSNRGLTPSGLQIDGEDIPFAYKDGILSFPEKLVSENITVKYGRG